MEAASQATETAASLAESVVVLPPLPITAQKILSCFGDEFIDADKVAEVVESDPGICAKLLGLANSAYFGQVVPLTQIREAISRVLGVDTVRSLVLAMAIQQSFSSKDCPNFDVERFWLQSLMTAECCKKLAALDDEAEDADRDLAYSAGLCHNLGLMALVHMEPERANRVLIHHRSKTESRSLTELTAEEFDTDYKIVTAELARSWSLPEAMVAAYQYLAFTNTHCDSRLGYIVAAAVAATQNTLLEEEERADLIDLSALFHLNADELQELAILEERQQERVQSLASNMTR